MRAETSLGRAWLDRSARDDDSAVRALPSSLLGLWLLLVAGCGPTIPDIPQAARAQTPRAAPRSPFFGQGRLELVVPGKRISCTALVRGFGDGRARLALMEDVSGMQLADLTATADGYQVTQAIDEVRKALPQLGRLVRHAWGLPADPPERLEWHDATLAVHVGPDTRWYGGDPVLLRAVEGDGLDLSIEDYRPLGTTTELIAHEARAKGPLGITIRIHLDPSQVWPRPATPPPGAAGAPAPAPEASASAPK
jgi:hypothetical protein